MKYRVRTVKYIDSAITAEQSSDIATPFQMTAVGFVIKENHEFITLAQEVMSNGDFRGQISIPIVAIIK